MWIFSAMYFCYAYNLSVYLVWFPKYLNDHRGFNLQRMGFYASLLLLAVWRETSLEAASQHSGQERTTSKKLAAWWERQVSWFLLSAWYPLVSRRTR